MTTTPPPDGSWMSRHGTDFAYGVGFALLATQVAAGSVQHAHDTLVQFGQGDPWWLPWTLAGTPDLLAVLSGVEVRRRRRLAGPTADVRVPMGVLLVAVGVLVATQVVQAQPSVGGVLAAAWPAVALLGLVALVETRPEKRRPRPAPAARRPVTAPAVSAIPPITSTRPPAAPVISPMADTDVRPDGPTAAPGPVLTQAGDLPEKQRAVWDALHSLGGQARVAEVIAASELNRDAVKEALRGLDRKRLVHSPERGVYELRRMAAAA